MSEASLSLFVALRKDRLRVRSQHLLFFYKQLLKCVTYSQESDGLAVAKRKVIDSYHGKYIRSNFFDIKFLTLCNFR